MGRWTWGRKSTHGQPIEVEIPAILDEQRWQALQAALNIRAVSQRVADHFYTLSGRLYGRCGGHYYGTYRKDRQVRQYCCRFKSTPPRCCDRLLNADPVEAGVWCEVSSVLGDPQRLMGMAADYLQAHASRAKLEGDQLAELSRRLANLDRAITTGAAEGLKAGLTGPQIAATIDQLQSERDALERHRTQLQAWAQHRAAASERKRRLWQLAETARHRLHTLTPAEQRQVLDLLDVRVFILKDATRRRPTLIRIEGTVHDTSLDTLTSREGQNVAPPHLTPSQTV